MSNEIKEKLPPSHGKLAKGTPRHNNHCRKFKDGRFIGELLLKVVWVAYFHHMGTLEHMQSQHPEEVLQLMLIPCGQQSTSSGGVSCLH